MKKEEFEAFQNAWIENSTSWEQGAEGPSATDRGSFKSGWFRALEWKKEQENSYIKSLELRIEQLTIDLYGDPWVDEDEEEEDFK
jgi:hypothetical protein